MDTQVTNTVVEMEQSGNLPVSSMMFYQEKPEHAIADHLRAVFLRFNLDKKENKKRANMLVAVEKIHSDLFTSKSQVEFLTALVQKQQDSLIERCADAGVTWEQVNSIDFLVSDFFDTSRDSKGRKITKETLSVWYMAKLGELVGVRAKAKNEQMTDETMAKVIMGWNEAFQKLTSYTLEQIYTPKQFDLISQIFASVEMDDSDVVQVWIKEKLGKIAAAMNKNAALEDSI